MFDSLFQGTRPYTTRHTWVRGPDLMFDSLFQGTRLYTTWRAVGMRP